MGTDITGKDILNAYRTDVSQTVKKKLTKISDINDKYKLTPGTEQDFNSAATFYMYSQVKNSVAIDNAETELSRQMGDTLIDYYKSYVSDDKLSKLFSSINIYNNEIERLYDRDKSENAIRILKNVYGIDPSNFAITEGSYAHRALLEIKNNYYNNVLPRIEMRDAITRIRENVQSDQSVVVEVVRNKQFSAYTNSQDILKLRKFYNIIYTELKKSTDILSSPKITYYNSEKNTTMELFIGTDVDIHNVDATHAIDSERYQKLIILVYNGNKITNESLTISRWHSYDPAYLDVFDTPIGFECSASDNNWTTGATAVNTTLETLLIRSFINIDDILFSTTNTTLKYEAVEVESGHEEDHYTFSSYEKQFLLFATFFFLYKKIYPSVTDGITIQSVNNPAMFSPENKASLDKLLTLNSEESETIIELNDGIGGISKTKLISNEWDIHTNIVIKLSETLSTNVNIKVGYLKDPYEYMGGSLTSSDMGQYSFSGQSNVASVSHITAIESGVVMQLAVAENFGKANDTPGFFAYPEMRKSYAVLNIKNIYTLIKKLLTYAPNAIEVPASLNRENPLRLGTIAYGRSNSLAARTEIFNDLKNTNLFSKLSHNESKIYIYEDKTLSLYTDLQNEDSVLEKLLITDLACENDFDKEFNVTVNSFKIYYEFTQPTATVLDKTIADIKASEKRYASDVEAYYAMNYYNLNYFEFKNILVDTSSDMLKELKYMFNKRYPNSDDITKKDFGLKPGSNDKYTTVSISILYKEFNPIIRDLTFANVQNRVMSEYQNSMSSNILNSKVFDYIVDYSKIEKISAIPVDNGKLFANLHTNSYIVRYSAVDDIVSYIAGDIINYGVSSQSKDEIQMLLNIYKETRDYFYKVLLNKAFAMEDQYALFKHIYIKAYAIDRFVSSRLTNLTEIKYYTTEDCRNFLISYGLKALSDQVDSANFADSITYKKRIIANYNNLMSMKGSRAIIDEFFKLFNYDTTEIVLYKYLLYKDEPTVITHFPNSIQRWQNNDDELTNYLKFVPVTYDSKNAMFNIKNNSKKAKKYDEFLSKDVYWDENELTPSIIDTVFESPVNTKYMGIDLKKDIYMSYIKAKYTMSLIDYLYKEFTTKFNKNYLANIKIALSEDGEDTTESDGFTILDIFNAIRYLFALYISINDAQMKNKDKTTLNLDEVPYNDAVTYATNHNIKYFYGINPSARISDLTFNRTFLTPSLMKELFTVNYANNETEMRKSNTIEYYTSGLYRNPALMSAARLDSYNTRDLLFGQDAPMPLPGGGYLIPLRLSSQYTTTNMKIFDETPYNKLTYCTGEIFSSDEDASDLNSAENTALSAIETAFKSINLVNFLNGLDAADPLNETIGEENEYKFKAVYYFEKFANSTSIYPANLSELGNIDDYESELKFPEKSNFYTCLFENVLSFPTKYMDGEFNITKGINYNYDIREILNEIFNKFFVVTDSDVIGYLNNTANSTTQYTFTNSNFIQTVYTNNPVIEYLANTIDIMLTQSGQNWTFEITGGVDTMLSSIADRIISLTDIIATAAEQYQLMKVDLQFGESINNFFAFIKTCVNFFISYTSMLYESNLILKIETQNERIPLTYKIFDSIEHQHHDYFYYDESIKVDEIIDQ